MANIRGRSLARITKKQKTLCKTTFTIDAVPDLAADAWHLESEKTTLRLKHWATSRGGCTADMSTSNEEGGILEWTDCQFV